MQLPTWNPLMMLKSKSNTICLLYHNYGNIIKKLKEKLEDADFALSQTLKTKEVATGAAMTLNKCCHMTFTTFKIMHPTHETEQLEEFTSKCLGTLHYHSQILCCLSDLHCLWRSKSFQKEKDAYLKGWAQHDWETSMWTLVVSAVHSGRLWLVPSLLMC